MKRLDKEQLAKAVEERAGQDLASCRICGASVLVAQAGEILYKKHLGAANLQGESLTDGTLFRLASMTKPITAVAAMILVERGALRLEDTVDRFYPAFSKMRLLGEAPQEERPVNITVKQLLTHTSGIMSGEAELAASKVMTDADKASVESYVSFLSRQPLSFLPGSKQEYSGTGAFSVLTGIIQKISGMPYEEFLKKEIFAPCCMSNTTFLPSDAQWARLVMMHDKTESGNAQGKTTPGCVFTSFPAQSFLGGAGLISSLGDYFNFAQMLLNGGVFEGKRVLSEASVAQIATPHFFKKEEESWGLGVRVISEDPRNVLPAGTFGWSGAFGTHFWVDPTNRVVAIYLKNSCYDGGAGALTSRNFEKDVYASLLN